MKLRTEEKFVQSASSTFHSHFSKNNKIILRRSCQNLQNPTSFSKNKSNNQHKYKHNSSSANQFLQQLKVKPQPLRNPNQKHTFKYFKSFLHQCHKHKKQKYNYFQKGVIIHKYINWIQKNIKTEIFKDWVKLQKIFYLLHKQNNKQLKLSKQLKLKLKQKQNNFSNQTKNLIKNDKNDEQKQRYKMGQKISLSKFQNNKIEMNQKKQQIKQMTQEELEILQNVILKLQKQQKQQIFDPFKCYNNFQSIFGFAWKSSQFNHLKAQNTNQKSANLDINKFKFEKNQWKQLPLQNLTLQKINNRISYMHPFLVQFSRQILIKKQNLLLDQILQNQRVLLDNSLNNNNKDLNYQQKRELAKRIIQKRLQSYQFLNKHYQKLGKTAQKYHQVYKKSLTKFYKSDFILNQNYPSSQIKQQNDQIENLLNDLENISKVVELKKMKQSQKTITKEKGQSKITVKGKKIKNHKRVASQGQVKQLEKQNVPIINYETTIKQSEDAIKKRKPFFLKAEARQSKFQEEQSILQKSFSMKKKRNFPNFRNTVKPIKDDNQMDNSKKNIKKSQNIQKSKTFHKYLQKNKFKKTKGKESQNQLANTSQQQQNVGPLPVQNKQLQKKSQRQSLNENNRFSIKIKVKQPQKQQKNQKFQIKINRKRYQSMSNKSNFYLFKKKQKTIVEQNQFDEAIELDEPKNISKQLQNKIQKDLKPKIQINMKNKIKKSKKKSADPFQNKNIQQKKHDESYPIMKKKQSNKIRRIKFLNLNFLPKKIIQMILRQFQDVKHQKNIIYLKQKLLNYFNKLLQAGCFEGRLSQYRTQVEEAIRQYQKNRRNQSQLKSFCFMKSKKDEKMSEQKFTIKPPSQNIYDCLKSFHNAEYIHKSSTFQRLSDYVQNEVCDISLFNLQCKRFSGFNLDLETDFISNNNSDQQEKQEFISNQQKAFIKENNLIQFLKAFIKGQETLLKQKKL